MEGEPRKVEFLGKDLVPTIKEVAFAGGVTLGSMAIGYLLVSGKWSSCIGIYQIVNNKLAGTQ